MKITVEMPCTNMLNLVRGIDRILQISIWRILVKGTANPWFTVWPSKDTLVFLPCYTTCTRPSRCPVCPAADFIILSRKSNDLKLVTWNPVHLNLKIYSKSFLTCDLYVCQRGWKNSTRWDEIAYVNKPIMQSRYGKW